MEKFLQIRVISNEEYIQFIILQFVQFVIYANRYIKKKAAYLMALPRLSMHLGRFVLDLEEDLSDTAIKAAIQIVYIKLNRKVYRLTHQPMQFSQLCGFSDQAGQAGQADNCFHFNCFGTCNHQDCPMVAILNNYTINQLEHFESAVSHLRAANPGMMPYKKTGLIFLKYYLENVKSHFQKK